MCFIKSLKKFFIFNMKTAQPYHIILIKKSCAIFPLAYFHKFRWLASLALAPSAIRPSAVQYPIVVSPLTDDTYNKNVGVKTYLIARHRKLEEILTLSSLIKSIFFSYNNNEMNNEKLNV